MKIMSVLISGFAAVEVNAGVELRWRTVSDEPMLGYKIYRSGGGKSQLAPLNADRLLPPGSDVYVDSNVQGGLSYEYVLGVVLADGSEMSSRVARIDVRPVELTLYQNYPNPFNPTTTISFVVPETGPVNISIYDVKGSLVHTLIDSKMAAGSRQISWDGKDNRGNGVGSGVYFWRLVFGKRSLTKRMILLK